MSWPLGPPTLGLRPPHVPEDGRNLPAEEVTQAPILANFVVARLPGGGVSGARNDNRQGHDQQDDWGVEKEEGSKKQDAETAGIRPILQRLRSLTRAMGPGSGMPGFG